MGERREETNGWGIDSEYGVLRDVLLGRPDYYRWVDAGPLTQRTLLNAEQLGVCFDLQLAQAQHAEMVRCYEEAGVACHFLEADGTLHRNFFARDSSAMTPFGPIICHMQLKPRRADYVTAIKFYREAGIPIFKMVTAGHFEGGDFVIVEPGAVLIGFGGERSEQSGAEQVAGWMRERGWEAVVAPGSAPRSASSSASAARARSSTASRTGSSLGSAAIRAGACSGSASSRSAKAWMMATWSVKGALMRACWLLVASSKAFSPRRPVRASVPPAYHAGQAPRRSRW